jgi:hypothetical protein
MMEDRISEINQRADCRAMFRADRPDLFRERGNSTCPWHEDSTPSLQVTKKLIYCHACQRKADAIDWKAEKLQVSKREAIEILCRELGINGNGSSGNKPSGRIIATYRYRDRDGDLLFEVVRFDPKRFSQRRPDGKGGWIWNLEGVERVIYHLPEVLNAGQAFITEGEKDADGLAALGLVATTSPQGAGKWHSEYCGPFRGIEEVLILPDNDEIGRKHALDVAGKLYEAKVVVGQNIKILELPGLPPKGDVSDWLQAGGTKEELIRLARECRKYKPNDGAANPENENAQTCFRDAILESDDFLRLQIPEKETYLNPWLKEQSIIWIVGWRGTGKTGFVVAAVDAITKKVNFGPWPPGKPVNCLYLDGEMAAQDIQRRLQDLGTANRLSKLYIYSDAYAHTLGLPKANLLDEEWRAGFQRTLLELGIKLWVCDNLASLSGGIDENSKEAWDPIGTWLLQLRFAGITTILIHHEGKGGQQRGTSAREDHADICISLKKPAEYSPEQGARFIASFTKSRIETEYLPLMADVEFQLMNTIGDVKEWTWKGAQQATKAQILKNLDDGLSQSAVVDLLKVSKGQVSKVRAAAIRDGWMTPQNRLTQFGLSALEG